VQRSVPALVVLAAVVALGCAAPPHVTERGAERIAGTEGVGGMLLDAYAVSPSGRLLLFARARPGEETAAGGSDVLAPLYGFTLLERATGRRRDVGVDPGLREAVESRPDLLLGSLCWAGAEDGVHLWVDAGPSVELDLNAPTLQWRLGASASPPDPVDCPPWQVTGQELLEGTGPFRVDELDRSIRLVDRAAPDRPLLDYRGAWLARDPYLRDVRLAPGGRRLAVVLSRGTGSFIGAAELFVLSREPGEPGTRSLGGPAFQVRWSRQGDELFAIASTGAGERERAIHRWRFPGEASQR
jgi:hypothetical protein